uniref:Uncharacterized protein n=1 Tax=Heterorhabditis bacteriophora TaxID=37862 RepID=A0A1I7WAF5_HETBA
MYVNMIKSICNHNIIFLKYWIQ